MATLLALFGPKRGVRIDLAETCVVGRLSAADVQLIDEKVSREHCKFTVVDGAVKVEDLGSHNGTFVNGEQLAAPRMLAQGDEIAVGDSLFVFQPDLDVAPARFGDATLIVSPATPPGAAVDPGLSASPRAASVTPAHLAAVAKLAGALAGAADTESAARAVLDAIGANLKGDRAFVLLWDPARRAVTPLVGRSDGPAVTISRRVLETAADGKKVVSIDDAVESRSFKDSKSVIRHGLRSVLVAPVMHAERVEGFLHIDSKQVSAYTEADVHLLTAFAALAASHRLGVPRAHAPVAPRIASGGGADRPAGESAAWKEALRIAESAAAVSSTILVTGESGTGKEEVARFVHHRSPRSAKPFVAVNCGAIPEALAESELFGHEKGAFTGATGMREGKVEAADGGTLFLDEIGDLPLSIQVKLLRVLQERAFYRVGSTIPRRVDIRVIAATHHDLESEVKSGRFREDLFYRLNVLRIHLPPLRDRIEDLDPLAQALLTRVCVTVGRKNPGLSKEALAALQRHPWPGNARELANVLERMVVLRPGGPDGAFGRADVAAALGAGPYERFMAAAAGDPGPDATLAEKVAALEKSEVESALKRARGVKSRAAEMLGISRPTLDKKIADLAIDIWKDVQG